MHDVVIVGGGLAGAAAAIHLAERGRDVVIIERRRAYRHKACGEGLFPLGVAELDRLGLLRDVACASHPLDGLRFFAGDQHAVADMGPGRGGIGIQRAILDGVVLERARVAGAQVRDGITARALVVDERRATGVITDDGEVRARAVIGADGLNSRIRRLAGLECPVRGDRYGVAAHLRVSWEPEPFVDIHIGGGMELYLTPVGDRLINAAVLTRRGGMRAFAGNLATAYERLLRDHPALSEGFELIDEPAAAGPFAAGARRAFRGNVVLAGDAAGFFDGITGEGMSTALISARLCAEAVDEHLRGGDLEPLRMYDARRRALVRNAELIGRISLMLAGHSALGRLAVRNLGRRPATFRRLAVISSGERGLRSLRPRDALALAAGL